MHGAPLADDSSGSTSESEPHLYAANMAAPTRRRRLWEIVAGLWRELHDDGLFDTAAGVAFWLLLSIPAALLATLSSVSLLGENLTGDLQASINEFIDRTFTTESSTIRDAVDGLFDQNRPGVLSVSVAVAIFTLSRGFAGLIRALDVAYDIERPGDSTCLVRCSPQSAGWSSQSGSGSTSASPSRATRSSAPLVPRYLHSPGSGLCVSSC